MIELGKPPTTTSPAEVKPPFPSPSRTEMLPASELATAMSALPSLLKSPTAIERGLVPTLKGCEVPKPPAPSPSATDTVAKKGLLFVIAKSTLPSPLKSATATKPGSVVNTFGAAVNFPPPEPSRIETTDPG